MAKSPNDFTKHDATDVFQNIRSINDFTAGLISDIRQNVLPPSAGATIQQIKLAQQRLRVAQRSLIKARSTTIQFNKRFNTRNFDEWGDPNTDIVIINQVKDMPDEIDRATRLLNELNQVRSALNKLLSNTEEQESLKDRLTQEDQAEQKLGNNDNDPDNAGRNTAADAVSGNENSSYTQNPSVGTTSESTDNLQTDTNAQNPNLRKDNQEIDARPLSVDDQFNSEDAVTTVGDNDQQYGDVTYKNAFFKPIVTQENPLLQFAHYTYNIGIYLQTPEQYVTMITTGNKSTQGLLKVLESGGTGAVEGSKAIFPDIFIEDLEIQTLMMGNNPGAHNAVDLNFTIVEPMGFTFLQKLRELCTANNMYGLTNQHYLMVIKFIGYDENGNEVTPANAEAMSKYIPFKFSKITTTVRTGAVQYACMATPPNYNIGQSVKRAAIRFNVELTGRTLNDIFNADGSESLRGTSYGADTGREFDDSGGYEAYAKRNAVKIKASKNCAVTTCHRKASKCNLYICLHYYFE